MYHETFFFKKGGYVTNILNFFQKFTGMAAIKIK